MKVGLLFLFLGCAVAFSADRESSKAEIERALDSAQEHLDEYGTISVSAPILTYARSNEFAFRLTNGASFYFNDAKTNIQGRAAAFNQSFQSFMFRGQAEADPTVAGAYMAASQNYLRDLAAYQLQQQTLKEAANAQLQSTLALAATNTAPGASNAAAAEALRTYASQVYGTNGPPVFPMASSFNTNLPTAPSGLGSLLTDTNYGRLQAMQGFLGLLNNMSSGLSTSDRAALLTAAGDNAVESFFRALGDSTLYRNFLNPEIYYGAITVSVNPGWRTKRDWAAEVSVRVELQLEEARRETVLKVLNDPKVPIRLRVALAEDYGYPLESAKSLESAGLDPAVACELFSSRASKAPHVDNEIPHSLLSKVPNKPVEAMVISPMIEAETFDLASSYRQQSEFALALAAALTYAGAKGQAEAFEKFAKSRQFDIATRSPLATVNAFSGQEGSFGFQIGPRIQAMTNPGKNGSPPGNVLERQAFPALLIITTSAGELEPRIVLETDECCLRFRVKEPYLALRQTKRWIPLSRKFFSGRDWYMPGRWFHPKLSESERVETVDSLETAEAKISDLEWRNPLSISPHSTMADALRQRFRVFERELIGSVDTVAFPPDRLIRQGAPKITSAVPSKLYGATSQDGKLNPETDEFLFIGENLDLIQHPFAALVPPESSEQPPKILEAKPGFLRIRAKITNAVAPIIFQVPLNSRASVSTLITPPIPIEVQKPLPRIVAVEPRLIRVPNTKGNPGSTNITMLLVGDGLDRVATNDVKVLGEVATLNKLEKFGTGLRASLTVTNVGQALVMEFPVPSGDSLTNFILSPGVQLELEPKASESKPEQSNQSSGKSGGIPLESLTPVAGVLTIVNTNNAANPGGPVEVTVSISPGKTNAPAK